jgi:hypothetical protein
MKGICCAVAVATIVSVAVIKNNIAEIVAPALLANASLNITAVQWNVFIAYLLRVPLRTTPAFGIAGMGRTVRFGSGPRREGTSG